MRSRGLASLILLLPLACAGDDPANDDDAAGSEDQSTTQSETETGPEPSETDTETGDTDEPLEGYDDPALWLCHPDKDPGDDQCLTHDLSATVVAPDGSTTVVPHTPVDAPEFDCFYVYPTVDLRLTPGQTENFDDIS